MTETTPRNVPYYKYPIWRKERWTYPRSRKWNGSSWSSIPSFYGPNIPRHWPEMAFLLLWTTLIDSNWPKEPLNESHLQKAFIPGSTYFWCWRNCRRCRTWSACLSVFFLLYYKAMLRSHVRSVNVIQVRIENKKYEEQERLNALKKWCSSPRRSDKICKLHQAKYTTRTTQWDWSITKGIHRQTKTQQKLKLYFYQSAGG